MNSASSGNPQSNNLYAYVRNMPTDFVDPTGLQLVILRQVCRPIFATTPDGLSYYLGDYCYDVIDSIINIGNGPSGTNPTDPIVIGPGGGGGIEVIITDPGDPEKLAACAAAAREAHEAAVNFAREKNKNVSTDLTRGDMTVLAIGGFIGTIKGGGSPLGTVLGLAGAYSLTKAGKYIDKYGDVFFAKYFDDKLIAALRRCANFGPRRR